MFSRGDMNSRTINAAASGLSSATVLSKEASTSLKKRWLYLMPAVFVTYSLAYLDRANYGFGAAAGLTQTLHLTPTQASLLPSLFFLGYFAFQIPGAALAKRWSVSRV